MTKTNALSHKTKLGKQICPYCGEAYYFRYVTNKAPSMPNSWRTKVCAAWEEHKKVCSERDNRRGAEVE